jgi:hypothetical protein
VRTIACAACVWAASVPAAFGRELPGAAEGGGGLRYACLEATLDPPDLMPGLTAVLTVSIEPRPEYLWYDALLAAPSIQFNLPAGWSVQGDAPGLSPIGAPRGRRSFRVSVARSTGAADGAIELALRYGVVSSVSGTGGALFVEEAYVSIAVPATGMVSASEAVGPGTARIAPGGAAGADVDGESRRSSPLVPALVFAAATVLVLTGIAVSFRHAKACRDDD